MIFSVLRRQYRRRFPGAQPLALVAVVLTCAGHRSDEVSPEVASPMPTEPALAFTGVTVIDVRQGQHMPNTTVVIKGTRIHEVGPAAQVAIPQGAQVVDASAKYMIPGLWDMHVHLGLGVSRADIAWPLFIGGGVTGIREMAQRYPAGADSFRTWRREIASGVRVGPRIVGPSADLMYAMKLETPADARRIFDSLKTAGDAFVKFHDDVMSRDLYFTILRESRRTGVRVLGHVPEAVTTVEAIDSGHYSFDHFNEVRCWMLPRDSTRMYTLPKRDTLVVDRDCATTVSKLVSQKIWLVPTLRISEFSDVSAIYRPREIQRFIRTMYRAGVRMLAGTDASWDRVIVRRALALHRELELFAGAGLTPLEALQTATINPAEFLGLSDSLGTIERGKLADLLLLDADPLVDIRHTTAIRAVVANGRYFDRMMLDSLNAAGERAGVRFD